MKIENKMKSAEGQLTIKNENNETIGQMDMHFKSNAQKLQDARMLHIEAEVEGEKIFEDTIVNPNPPTLSSPLEQ